MRDRYGNSVTTADAEACSQYCLGIDRFLAAQSGGIEALQNAIRRDPDFALAHADLARVLQIHARVGEAREHIERARMLLDDPAGRNLPEQEAEHIRIMQLLLRGKGDAAFQQIQSHITRFPRDVMALAPCCGVFGLIGFSGRAGREQENADFMAPLAKHYAGDWWFESQYAFALCEIGELHQAETLNEQAFALNPDNANAVHHRAHIHYETAEFTAGRKALQAWRKDYPRSAILHCHLAWHDALWALAEGAHEQVWEILAADIMPGVTSAPPINVMTDMVALLARAEFSGVPVPDDLWRSASDYALASFPKAGVSFADAHSALAWLKTDNAEALDGLLDQPRGWASDVVAALAMGYRCYLAQDWRGCEQALAGVMSNHERLGGSRAQRDLLELLYARARNQLNRPVKSTRPVLQ